MDLCISFISVVKTRKSLLLRGRAKALVHHNTVQILNQDHASEMNGKCWSKRTQERVWSCSFFQQQRVAAHNNDSSKDIISHGKSVLLSLKLSCFPVKPKKKSNISNHR